MAGNFYNLGQVTEKLGKSEDEVKALVKQGKLREFRDGANLLFKMDEVDKLAEETRGLDISAAEEVAKADLAESGGSEVELSLEETSEEVSLSADEGDLPDDAIGDLDLTSLGDLTAADTKAGTTGISVLGDTDDGYKLAADTKGETVAAEESDDILGDLDDDLNMESVGSGSGLLDLSLQADDTSLGAVLDDILPAAAEGGDAEIVPGQDLGLVEEEQVIVEQRTGTAVGAVAAPVAAAPMAAPGRPVPAYYEPEPTGADHAVTISMFIPLAAMVLVGVIMWAVANGIMPALVETLEGPMFMEIPTIWVVAGGLALLVLLIVLIGGAMGGKKAPRKPKPGEVYQQPA